MLAAVLVLLALAVGLVISGVVDRDLLEWSWLGSGSSEPDGDALDAATPPRGDRSALLVATSDEGALRWLAVLATPASGSGGTVVLLPPGLIADVPGHGTFTLREAKELGGTPLVAASVANLLGLRLDAAVTVTQTGWGRLAEEADGIDVALRAGVDDPERGVRLEPGDHRLDGTATVAVLEAAGPPLGELETLARIPPVLGGVLDAVRQQPTLADRLLAVDDDPVLDTDGPQVLVEVLDGLAAARERDDLAVLTLPVVPVGDGQDIGFRVDEERAAPLLADQLGPWRPEAGLAAGRDVQILNGNGVPRIGQQVTALLADGGYRVVLTGNADRFTHETTRIILHADTPDQVAIGQDVQQRLGVGELELAATPSSVVDVTIVVGRDFPPAGSDGS